MLNQPTLITPAASPSPGEFGARILHLVHRLAHWSELPEGLKCTYFSPEHKAVAAQLRDWLLSAGLEATIDGVGNVIGRYPSDTYAAKTLVVGSHYDTVANAGKFDGRLGILTALVVAEYLNREKRRLPFHLEVIGFSEEEGVRFGAPYIGSSAIVGRFNEDDLARRDANGISLAAVLKGAGIDFAAVQKLARRPEAYRGYLEVHIEQGPVLLHSNVPLGVVTSIAGSVRFHVTIHGVAGHAGTVPMSLRRDAAAAAAEMVLEVERRCASNTKLVGTVGQLSVPHGIINVIPGFCELSLDVRSIDDTVRDGAIADIVAAIQKIANRRQVTATVKEIARHDAVPCAPQMQSALAQAIARAGIETIFLPSGAGHDAEMFAGIADIGMLFVRSGNGGVSHSPLESVTAEDADVAARVLLDVLVNLH